MEEASYSHFYILNSSRKFDSSLPSNPSLTLANMKKHLVPPSLSLPPLTRFPLPLILPTFTAPDITIPPNPIITSTNTQCNLQYHIHFVSYITTSKFQNVHFQSLFLSSTSNPSNISNIEPDDQPRFSKKYLPYPTRKTNQLQLYQYPKPTPEPYHLQTTSTTQF